MRVLFQLSALALRQVFGPGADSALLAIGNRFGDRSDRLLETLRQANAQAWKAVEIALAGSSWWDRCKRTLSSGEQYAFRQQVQAFLDATPLDDLPGAGAEFRRRCLAELRDARKARVVPGEALGRLADLGEEANALAKFDDPRAVINAELLAVGRAAADLRAAGYEHLGRFLNLAPPGGRPPLVVAVQYFFRKDVQADPELSAELQFQEVEALGRDQRAGFESLQVALAQFGGRIDGLLEDALELLGETRDLTREARDDVRALRDEMAEQQRSLQAMYQAMLALLSRRSDQQRPGDGRPADLPEDTLAEMRNLVEQCDTLPVTEKRQHKALFRAVGKLKAEVRAYDARRRLRKNVLPSALFSEVAKVPSAMPSPVGPPLLGPAFTVEVTPTEAKTTEAAALPLAPANKGQENSVFGLLPKPKQFRRKRDGQPD